jgi:predicted nucleic acid-binding protein
MELLSYNFSNKKEEAFILAILSKLNILYLDMNIANSVIKLKRERKIKLPDAIIVATAKVNNLTLFTNDKQLLSLDIKTRYIELK